MVSEVPPQISVLAALLIAVAGCDQGTVAGLEEDGGAPGSPTMHVADEAASVDHLAGAVPDGLLDLTAGRQRGARSVDGEAVPAWIESMLEVELPEGYSALAMPRRLEIRDVRLGMDALRTIRPDRLSYEPGQEGHAAWSVAGGTSALQPMEPCLPPIITGTGSGAEGRTQHSERPCPPDGPIDPPPPDDPPDPGNPPIICPETVGAHGDCPPIEDPPDLPPTPPATPQWVVQSSVYGHGLTFKEFIEFMSYSLSNKPVSYISVVGHSFTDGLRLVEGHDWAYNGNIAAVAWTYHAEVLGHRYMYEQIGDHHMIDLDSRYPGGMFESRQNSYDFHINL